MNRLGFWKADVETQGEDPLQPLSRPCCNPTSGTPPFASPVELLHPTPPAIPAPINLPIASLLPNAGVPSLSLREVEQRFGWARPWKVKSSRHGRTPTPERGLAAMADSTTAEVDSSPSWWVWVGSPPIHTDRSSQTKRFCWRFYFGLDIRMQQLTGSKARKYHFCEAHWIWHKTTLFIMFERSVFLHWIMWVTSKLINLNYWALRMLAWKCRYVWHQECVVGPTVGSQWSPL